MGLNTTALFLSQVERRSFMPAGQASFLDPEILTIATEEMNSKILPAIVKTREEYYVAHKDLSITANQIGYDIPSRSFNNTLREVQIVRSNVILDIPRINLEDRDNEYTGLPIAFYPSGDQVRLYPEPSSTTDILRLHYILPPGGLVEATSTGVISAINTSTSTVTITSIPSTWATGDIFDFVSKNGAHAYREVDQTSTTVSGSDIIFASLPSDLVVGDYVMPQNQSSLVQIPKTMVPVLAQYTAAALLNYAGQPGGEQAEELADKLLKKAIDSMSPRVTGEMEFFQQSWY